MDQMHSIDAESSGVASEPGFGGLTGSSGLTSRLPAWAGREKEPPINRGIYLKVVKPTLDQAAAAIGLIIILPLLALISLAILISLGRPVIFRQTRIGYRGQPFLITKFRTMRPDRRTASMPIIAERRAYHKSSKDPRHTRLGRVLRRSSLDELPQLWDILRGKMSFVGPRPELPHVVAEYSSWQHLRHAVKPGLTGLWQVTARGNGPMQAYADLDVAYAMNVSAIQDLEILIKTLPATVRGD